MQAEFWLERWQRKEIGFHQPQGNPYLHRYWSRLVLPHEENKRVVLVPLCGKSRDLLWLRDRGHAVLGVELAPQAVQDFFRENDLTPQRSQLGAFDRWQTDGIDILCGDFFALESALMAGAALAFDRAALIAMPPDMLDRYVAKLAALLPGGAKVLLVAMEYDQSQMAGPPFSVHETEVRRLFEGAFEVALLERCDVLAENARLRERGLTRMHETVYLLHRR